MTIKPNQSIVEQEALDFHANGQPGKIAVIPTKPLATQHDLSLAYSPGVAIPCLAIQKDPSAVYRYTAKGNMVAVISNGTAVLGLGKIGALAAKPVMEGKVALFKSFADIDAIDIEVDTTDTEAFINAVRYLGVSWGGINLEDIASPACFVIEETLKKLLTIPVFHDDQHGTAIVLLAGLMNATQITGRDIKKMQVVVNGPGAAGIACMKLMKRYGLPDENIIAVDRVGVVYKDRTENMNPWKAAHATQTNARTLADVIKGADVFIGLSTKDILSPALLKLMAPNPIVFALANPNPEISPETAKATRTDVLIATGRSDYPNQVNNLIAFPYIFRGALDVRASTINNEMKLAAAKAISSLAREPVPAEVSALYKGRKMEYGSEYIVPSIFDPRLIYTVPYAVAQAAMESGVAQKPIEDMKAYQNTLKNRLRSSHSLAASKLK